MLTTAACMCMHGTGGLILGSGASWMFGVSSERAMEQQFNAAGTPATGFFTTAVCAQQWAPCS